MPPTTLPLTDLNGGGIINQPADCRAADHFANDQLADHDSADQPADHCATDPVAAD